MTRQQRANWDVAFYIALGWGLGQNPSLKDAGWVIVGAVLLGVALGLTLLAKDWTLKLCKRVWRRAIRRVTAKLADLMLTPED